jgi:hypothetical protein
MSKLLILVGILVGVFILPSFIWPNTPIAEAQRGGAVVRSPVATRSPAVQRPVSPSPTPTITRTPTRTNTPIATSTPAITNTLPATITPGGTTLIVGPSDTYTAINQAVAAAGPGYTIRVHAGTYPEFVNLPYTGMTLVGYGDGIPFVDGACLRDNGIQIDANDVTIRSMGIKRTNSAALITTAGRARANIDQNTIQDYNCANNDDQLHAGIQAYYGGPAWRVTGNHITYSVNLNRVQRGPGNGVWFKSNTANSSGGGHYIADNFIIGGFDGIGGEDEADIHGSFDGNTTIERNDISQCDDDGVQIEGGDINVVVQDNKINGCGIGVAVATAISGPARIQRNYITSNQIGRNGALLCFKVGFDSAATVFINDNNCELDWPTSIFPPNFNAGKGIEQTNDSTAVLNVTNNWLKVSGYVYEFAADGPRAGSVFNNNCMVTLDNSRFVKYGGTQYTTLAAFQSATGQEAAGRVSPCTADGTAPTPVTIVPTSTVLTQTPTSTGTPFTPTPIVAITQPPTRTAIVGTTIHVCADSNPCIGPPGGSFSTIAGALGAASVGSTIIVHTGTYPEQVTLNKTGLTLRRNGTDNVWITGSCARPYGIVVDADNVTVYDMGVKNTINAGILVSNLRNYTSLDLNRVQDYNCQDLGDDDPAWIAGGRDPRNKGGIVGDQIDAGISFVYAGTGQRVTNNTIRRRVDQPGSVYGQGDGLFFKSATGFDKQSNGGHYIANNVIIGGFDGIGGEVEQDPHGTFDKNTVVENNIVSQCWDDGIQNEGGGDRIYIHDNIITDCATGFAMATPLTGPMYFYNNTINSAVKGFYGEIVCVKVGNAAPATVTNPMFLRNNTCTVDVPSQLPGGDLGKGIEQTNSGLGTIITYNNAWQVSGYVYELPYNAPGSGSIFDFDCMYTIDPGRFIKWNNVQYSTLASFRAARGQELFGSSGPCNVPNTLTPTITPTRTNTFTPTSTNTTGPSPTFTQTPLPTNTPTRTATPTNAPTALFSLLHATTVSGSAAPLTVTIPATAANSLLVACVTNADNRTVTNILSSTGTNTVWVPIRNLASSGVGAALYYNIDVGGGTTGVTVSMSGSTTPHVDIGEFSGGLTSNIGLVAAQAGPVTDAAPVVAWSPAKDADLTVACSAASGLRTWTAGANNTKLSTDSGDRVGASEYNLRSIAGAITTGFSLSSSATWMIATGEFLQNLPGVSINNAMFGFASSSLNTGLVATSDLSSLANQMMLVTIAEKHAGGTSNITGMTWDGEALTKIGEAVNATGLISSAWYIVAPNTGTGLDLNATVTGTTDANILAFNVGNVNQTTPIGTTISNVSSSASWNGDVTTTQGGDVVFDSIAINSPTQAFSQRRVGSGQVEIGSGSALPGFAQIYTSRKFTLGTTGNMAWNITGQTDTNHAHLAIPIIHQ